MEQKNTEGNEHDKVKQQIRQHVALAHAVDELVEHAEPIYSGNSDDPVEYVVPAEEYQAMFDILVGIKKS